MIQRNVKFTTRLQKGGALLEDMRRIVSIWSEEYEYDNPISKIARILSKATMARVEDTYLNAFRPRFINGSPPNAWKLAKVLEEYKVDIMILRPFYYWITARAEAPLYEFVSEFLYYRTRNIDRRIRIQEVFSWLTSRLHDLGIYWTSSVTLKVAQGILAALRDFGILEGKRNKQISTIYLPERAFILIAFLLYNFGAKGRSLVLHPDWRLFLLNDVGVEHFFLEGHRHGWLKYYSAGDIKRIEFPNMTFSEFTNEILR